MIDLTTQIIRYEEDDDFTYEEFINLFSELIKNKMAWSLQGHYGRTALELIQSGRIDNDGTINFYYGD